MLRTAKRVGSLVGAVVVAAVMLLFQSPVVQLVGGVAGGVFGLTARELARTAGEGDLDDGVGGVPRFLYGGVTIGALAASVAVAVGMVPGAGGALASWAAGTAVGTALVLLVAGLLRYGLTGEVP